MADLTKNPVTGRDTIGATRLLVVKIGSSSLTSSHGVDPAAIHRLADVLAPVRAAGTAIVLVSSGSVAAGLPLLGYAKKPRDLPTQQAASAVGQGQLMAYYTDAFRRHGEQVAQVLLTAEDLIARTSYTNAFRAINRLLNLNVTPVVNENDTVATQELRFGDNDRLAALVATVLKADLLLLLSDVDSLYDGPPTRPGVRRISQVDSAADLEGVTIGSVGSSVGTGGMRTKVEAATIATNSAVPTLLTSAGNAAAALRGEDVGTWFSAVGPRQSARNAWLGLMAEMRGRVVLDDGAVTAVVQHRRSLLPAGITGVEGRFEAGDPVELADQQGRVVARGLVHYSAGELPAMLGRSTRQLRQELGPEFERVVVHTDDCVRVSGNH